MNHDLVIKTKLIMMVFKYIIGMFLLCISVFSVFSCKVNMNKKVFHSQKMFNQSISYNKITYDTINMALLYEEEIPNYIFGDAILKRGGFIKYENNISINKLYHKAYFINNLGLLQIIKLKSNSFNFDTLSTAIDILSEVSLLSNKEGQDLSNRYRICNNTYRRCHMVAKVAYLGNTKQILPLFDECDSTVFFHKRPTIKMEKVPTYIITNIFKLEFK